MTQPTQQRNSTPLYYGLPQSVTRKRDDRGEHKLCYRRNKTRHHSCASDEMGQRKNRFETFGDVSGNCPSFLKNVCLGRWSTNVQNASPLCRVTFLCVTAILLFFSSPFLSAGGYRITHYVPKTSIKLQLEKVELEESLKDVSPLVSEAQRQIMAIKIEAEHRMRLNLGVGEEIIFRIEADPPDKNPFPLNETKWTIEPGKYVEAGAVTTTPAKNSSLSRVLLANSAQDEPVVVYGAQITIRVKTDKELWENTDDATVRVSASYGNQTLGGEKLKLYKPLRWKVRMRPPRMDAEFAEGDGYSPLYSHLTTAVELVCQPSNVNFEALYFREEDRGQRLEDYSYNFRPIAATIERGVFRKKYRKEYGHVTGDSDPTTNSIRKISYEGGIYTTVDDFGGPMVDKRKPLYKNGKLLRINGEVVTIPTSATSAEMKYSVDLYGEHSFTWLCYWGLFTDEKLDAGTFDMKEVVTQKFKVDAITDAPGGTAYYGECRKWNNFSRRTGFASGRITYEFGSRNIYRTQDQATQNQPTSSQPSN